jgi:mRNA interferase MazF
MLTSGDVVDVDFGEPVGREAGFARPAVVITAQAVLDESPSIVQVIPVTSTVRQFRTEVPIGEGAGNGLNAPSVAQCQHIRAVSVHRVTGTRGNVGPVALAQIRGLIGRIVDLIP